MGPVAGILLDLALLALLGWLGLRIFRAVAPPFYVARGRHERARALYERLARRGLFASTRRLGRYGVAVCDLQLGRLEQALASLRALGSDPLGDELRLGVDVAIGTTLLQLERDMDEARERFERAVQRLPQPDILLGLAHAELALGHDERAIELAEEAAAMPATGTTLLGREALLRRSAPLVEHSTDFLLGWFLAKVGREDEAAPLLEEVARWPVQSWITDKARTLLAGMDRPAPEPADEPPSTAAVVIDKD